MNTPSKSTLYTRTGDTGTTALVDGSRTPKDSARLEAYGTIDELNSHIGLLMALDPQSPEASVLLSVQHRLFDIGGYLACPPADVPLLPPGVTAADITLIEQAIDRVDSQLPRHNRFILPGGCQAAAQAHVARTVARRAERRIITLAATEPVDPAVLRYINRLSDYLFALARFNNVRQETDEIFWEKNC
ncbi:MAG: cob(I)yrinic acid a,c-diamide adenosyltransferase [Paramuribaculum sp.]|nr:cob(I)yrinic acid a,c-diamide adenosyltransferase [Paramuribaculum sp.]